MGGHSSNLQCPEAKKHCCHQTARAAPWASALNLRFTDFKTDLKFGGKPQTSWKWTDTHISCPCRETRSPAAGSDTKPRAGSLSHFVQVPTSAEAEQQDGSITSHFTAHPAGPWVLCQLLPFSRQFIWVDFSEMVKSGPLLKLLTLLCFKWRIICFSLLKKSGVSKQVQKMIVNFFERESKSVSWSLRTWT